MYYARWCIEKDWVFIHPNFRGSNKRPQATGSDMAVQDILDAVEYAKKKTKVDDTQIYLVGSSGGGYTALLMAGRAPKVWAGVSAWVPIVDLVAWHQESTARKNRYAGMIKTSVGGSPATGTKAQAECIKRSPITYLKNSQGLALDINAGVNDGHEIVPQAALSWLAKQRKSKESVNHK